MATVAHNQILIMGGEKRNSVIINTEFMSIQSTHEIHYTEKFNCYFNHHCIMDDGSIVVSADSGEVKVV